ncbi:hypothetical protein [Nostoc phage A1]|nr:hypothetical protein [Nostoc phage A1]
MKTTFIFNDVQVDLTDAFKKRIRLFAQMVYKLDYCPTIRQLEKLLGLKLVKPRGIGANLRQYHLNWMTAYKTIETDLEISEENQYQFANRMDIELKKAIVKYELTGSGKLTTSIDYRFDVYARNDKGFMVCVGYFHADHINKRLTISFSANGVKHPIANIGNGCHKLIAIFKKQPVGV